MLLLVKHDVCLTDLPKVKLLSDENLTLFYPTLSLAQNKDSDWLQPKRRYLIGLNKTSPLHA